MDLAALETEALKLSPRSRVRLAEKLLVSKLSRRQKTNGSGRKRRYAATRNWKQIL